MPHATSASDHRAVMIESLSERPSRGAIKYFRRHVVVLMLTICVGACQTTKSDVVCPQLIEYSPEIQKQAAAELQTLPPGGVIRSRFMPDYGTMRGEVRACRKV